jgi:hypothetical protein
VIDKMDGIGGTRGVTGLRDVRRTAKPAASGGTAFVKHMESGGESEAALASGGIGSLGSVSQIVGLQEVDDALARRKRGKTRAGDLLDKLESIRVALLTGSIGKDQLLRLAQMVNSQRTDAGDPRLNSILDDIELRARVELAKLGF